VAKRKISTMIGTVDSAKLYVLAEDYAGYNSPYQAQHGVSFLIDAKSGDIRRRILFDVGSYAEPILFNMNLLEIDPKKVDMIVLSHTHFDHTGGLPKILEEAKKNELPVIAHPDIFKTTLVSEPSFWYIGMPKINVDPSYYRWISARESLKLMNGIISIGEIAEEEKVNFEREVTLASYYIHEGKLVTDTVGEELSIAILSKEGLSVISGCSHAGIVSIVKKAIKVTGVDKVKAVIGGFHLIDADNSRREQTVKVLKELGVKRVYTGHCTGLSAECMFLKVFGEDFEKLHCGAIIDL
jgi:7,8-dihydropterin-6-yl-methyl-4-(beta-D-ribofuranosyl)aminobenzene 5'-phosphate synthase